MTHISLDEILKWEKQEDKYTFTVLDKNHFDVELKRYPPERKGEYTNLTHDRDELYYVMSGSGEVSVGDDTYESKEGEMIFVEQGVEHEFHNRENEIVVLKILAGS